MNNKIYYIVIILNIFNGYTHSIEHQELLSQQNNDDLTKDIDKIIAEEPPVESKVSENLKDNPPLVLNNPIPNIIPEEPKLPSPIKPITSEPLIPNFHRKGNYQWLVGIFCVLYGINIIIATYNFLRIITYKKKLINFTNTMKIIMVILLKFIIFFSIYYGIRTLFIKKTNKNPITHIIFNIITVIIFWVFCGTIFEKLFRYIINYIQEDEKIKDNQKKFFDFNFEKIHCFIVSIFHIVIIIYEIKHSKRVLCFIIIHCLMLLLNFFHHIIELIKYKDYIKKYESILSINSDLN